MCLGISVSSKASVEVITLFLSILINGKEEGLEPVAIMTLSVSICEVLPSLFYLSRPQKMFHLNT